jgi:hypothetical protein
MMTRASTLSVLGLAINKCDLVEERRITREEAEAYAKSVGAIAGIRVSVLKASYTIDLRPHTPVA